MTKQFIYNMIERDSHHSKLSRTYDLVMIFTIFVSLIPLLTREVYPIYIWIDWFTSALFIIDYLLRWYTADCRFKKSDWTNYLIYPFTMPAIIDLLSILPVISYFNHSLRIFKMWRLIRVLRVARIFRYYEPLQIMLRVFIKKANLLVTVIYFVIFYILTTALFMFNVEPSVHPETGEHFFDTYLDAIYWAACTLTTVGYGDVYPITVWGKIVSMMSSLVGIAIVALPSGIITAGYMEEINEMKERNERQKTIKNREYETINEN